MAGSVQSVDRAFAVLRQVASEPGGISDVARAVDLPVSTVARLLGTLESLGAVVRIGDSGAYGIGAGIRSLAGPVRAPPSDPRYYDHWAGTGCPSSRSHMSRKSLQFVSRQQDKT